MFLRKHVVFYKYYNKNRGGVKKNHMIFIKKSKKDTYILIERQKMSRFIGVTLKRAGYLFSLSASVGLMPYTFLK